MKLPSILFVIVGPSGVHRVRNKKQDAKRTLREALYQAQGTRYQGQYVLREYRLVPVMDEEKESPNENYLDIP